MPPVPRNGEASASSVSQRYMSLKSNVVERLSKASECWSCAVGGKAREWDFARMRRKRRKKGRPWCRRRFDRTALLDPAAPYFDRTASSFD